MKLRSFKRTVDNTGETHSSKRKNFNNIKKEYDLFVTFIWFGTCSRFPGVSNQLDVHLIDVSDDLDFALRNICIYKRELKVSGFAEICPSYM